MPKPVSILEDLQYLLKAQQSIINRAKHIATDDHYFESNRDRLQGHIDKLQRQLDDLIDIRENHKSIIAAAEKRKQQLRKQIQGIKHNAEIEKLMKLARQINDLEEEIDGDETE